ncbi:outer membrane protein assembly factor BamB family protein [Halorubrum lipolyticum]|uniref:Pyrrolo-quinoline quinone n=1 Tax=Halorubrum lipolyticum DSM 21995 TaxID=1227482 RepID=M0NY86_9EURY|nr:PQQ-binding-like beta-propeller repeat protein [Halorubrum lipolyticum]EMA61500.1 pyrrolo-quinoline quinone [Halorubrum lipolyticum DSM 21995]
MSERTRRDWLRALGAASTAGVVGLAGCSAFDAGGETEDDTSGNGGSGDGSDGGGSDGADRPTAGPDDGVKTQFRQGLRNTGYVDAAIPEAVETAWELPANRGDHSASKGSPIEAPNGAIVLADDTGRVQSIAPDGSVNWATSISDDDRGSHGTPAIADGSLYVGTYDGVVSAVALDDGEVLWQTDAGDAAAASPTYLDGKLYVAIEHATPSGSVVKMDAESGEIEWRDERPTNHPHSTVAIDREHGRLIFGSNDGHCYAWSFPDLEREWAYDTGGDVKLPLAISEGIAVVPSWAGTVTGLDVEDGSMLWEFETDGGETAKGEPDPGSTGGVMCAPAVHDGEVYVGSHDSNAYAIDLETGEKLWSTPTGGWITGSAVATNDHVLVGSYDAKLYALDRDDGSVTWTAEGRGDVTSAPFVTDDAIYYAERAPEGSDEAGMCYKLVARE